VYYTPLTSFPFTSFLSFHTFISGNHPLLRPRHLANLPVQGHTSGHRNVVNARDIDNSALGPFGQFEAIIILRRSTAHQRFKASALVPPFYFIALPPHQTLSYPAAGITKTPDYLQTTGNIPSFLQALTGSLAPRVYIITTLSTLAFQMRGRIFLSATPSLT
jgi:hypothetical protein